jgi:hypothetical protein
MAQRQRGIVVQLNPVQRIEHCPAISDRHVEFVEAAVICSVAGSVDAKENRLDRLPLDLGLVCHRHGWPPHAATAP